MTYFQHFVTFCHLINMLDEVLVTPGNIFEFNFVVFEFDLNTLAGEDRKLYLGSGVCWAYRQFNTIPSGKCCRVLFD